MRSIEEDVETLYKQRLISMGLKPVRKNASMNSEIDGALKTAESKSGGTGNNYPDIRILLNNGARRIPVMIEAKGKKGDLIKISNGEIVQTTAYARDTKTHRAGEKNYSAIMKYAVNGALHYALAVLDNTEYEECIAVGINGYPDENGSDTAPDGTYGKVVNVSKEITQLRKDILTGENVTRAVNMTTNGNDTLKTGTFLLVSIAHQTVTGYRNGKAILHSSVVTGKETADRRTRRGAFYIFARRSPAVLRGPGYASPVHSFSAFDSGRGFHDAPWRSVFGGTIYRYSGSHGCVNMPRGAADKLFSNFGIGTPVMVI